MKPAVQISLTNYEEFFLLYVDNELSAADRKAVEEFVLANPGLAVELEMLQQAMLSDDAMVFDDKKSLYRKESAEISLANYEEQFLLFVDNELAPDAKTKVETFVLQHPALQEGFTLLKQTKLDAEPVVCPDKASLYKKEEKERPVFYLRWQRIAVAAAFIGVALLVWNILPQEKSSQPTIASAGQETIAPVIVPGKNNSNGVSGQDNKMGGIAGADAVTAITAGANGEAARKVLTGIDPSKTNTTATVAGEIVAKATTNDVIAYTEAPRTTVVESVKGETVTSDNRNSFQTVAGSTLSVSGDHAAIENQALAVTNTDAPVGGPNNNDTHPAVYKELDTDDEKKSLLLGSLEINKDKLRGFFRKAGSIFRSKSKTDDEKTESRPSSNTRTLK